MSSTDILIRAIQENNLEGVRNALNNGVNPNSFDSEGRSPLYQAVRTFNFNSNINIIKELLHHGSNPNFFNKDDEEYPIFKAVIGYKYDVLKELLLNKANPNVTNQYGDTVLIEAVDRFGSIIGNDIVKLLIKNGAEVNNVNNEGKTALMKAIEKPYNEKAIEILLKNDADIDTIYNHEGKNAIDIARELSSTYYNILEQYKDIREQLQKLALLIYDRRVRGHQFPFDAIDEIAQNILNDWLQKWHIPLIRFNDEDNTAKQYIIKHYTPEGGNNNIIKFMIKDEIIY